MLLSVSLSVSDEYKMKGVEKVKYISGEEGGVDGQDSTVRDSALLFGFCFMSVTRRLLWSSFFKSPFWSFYELIFMESVI